jgi:transcriptional regulator with XRE-family HTH domain
MLKAGKRVNQNRSFGATILARRRELRLTQGEVARQIKSSIPFIGQLEANLRHPSDRTVVKLAGALGLDRIGLLFLANPEAQTPCQHHQADASSTWKQFKEDERMQRAHGVSRQDLEMLAQVTLMGDVRSARDFVYILNTIRGVQRRKETGKVSSGAEVQRCLR